MSKKKKKEKEEEPKKVKVGKVSQTKSAPVEKPLSGGRSSKGSSGKKEADGGNFHRGDLLRAYFISEHRQKLGFARYRAR